jgi:phosphatidylethanolamine-binding protein (PEBP) family uncharacterized protein
MKTQMLVSIGLSLLAGAASAAMSMTSTDIRSGSAIPVAHIYPRCGGKNISPNLSWSGAPSGTMSFVLTMIDVDVKPDEWSHWIVVGLPANLNSLARGAQSLPASKLGASSRRAPTPLIFFSYFR